MFFDTGFDRYMRPCVDLGHCRYKGGTTTKTDRVIPEQTAEEAALQSRLMNYADAAQAGARGALDFATAANENTFNPDWEALYNAYASANDDNMRHYTESVEGALGDYGNQVGSYGKDLLDALNQYTGREGDYLSQYQGAMDSARGAYDTAQGKRSPLWDDLVQGILPSAYAENRQKALNADLAGTMGNAVNSYANSGVLNSSVTNKALGDISQNAADTLYKNYQSDLALEASLLNQDKSNAKEAYDVASGNAGDLYKAQTGSNANVFGNTSGGLGNVIGQQGQYANAALNSANSWIGNALENNKVDYSGALTGQGASYEPVSNYLNYASQLYSPGENLFNTMYSGRMGTGSTTSSSKTSDGGAGVWSAVGSLGSAALLCFEGNTLVTTPYGYKEIRDVKPGDEVLSFHEGEVVTKRVKAVTAPFEKEVIDVVFENGQVWHTTRGQRYFSGRHFHFVEGGKAPVLVYDGIKTKVQKVIYSGRTALVYDIALEGSRGENVFFANDVAAEGFGEA